MPTIKDYFSTRISVSDIRSHVGASPTLTIQSLNGLRIVDIPINKMSGQNSYDPTQGPYFTGKKYDLGMVTDLSNEYTGSFFIQDPVTSPTGVSVPPTGTIGYFAKDEIPLGWLELGDINKFYLYKRQIGGTWNNPIYANTEYTEIYGLLNDWGFIKRSESRANQGLVFNTEDVFRGYFIKSFDPTDTKPIFDTTSTSYLSIHQHDGDSYYHQYVNGTSVDKGVVSEINESFGTFGTSFWFNYRWQVGLNWDLADPPYGSDDGGTVWVDHTSVAATTSGKIASNKFVTNFSEHIHGSIQTYYRGEDELRGKIEVHGVTGAVAPVRGRSLQSLTFLRPNSLQTSGGAAKIDSDQYNYTFYDPYRGGGALLTYYTGIAFHITATASAWITNTRENTLITLGTTSEFQTDTSKNTEVGVIQEFKPPNIITDTATFRSTDVQTAKFTAVDDHTTNETARNTYPGITFTGWNYTERLSFLPNPVEFQSTFQLGQKYFPYHILKSAPGTPLGSEFYNSGDNGLYVDVTSEAGNHNHDVAFTSVRPRGQSQETRPKNVALRMCVKF